MPIASKTLQPIALKPITLQPMVPPGAAAGTSPAFDPAAAVWSTIVPAAMVLVAVTAVLLASGVAVLISLT